VGAGEELRAGVGRRDGEADVVEGGEVWEVIAHEGDLMGGVAFLGQEVSDGLALVGEGEQERVQAQLAGARGGGVLWGEGGQPDAQAEGMEERDAVAVEDVEAALLAAVGVHPEATVGEDAVAVEQQEADGGEAGWGEGLDERGRGGGGGRGEEVVRAEEAEAVEVWGGARHGVLGGEGGGAVARVVSLYRMPRAEGGCGRVGFIICARARFFS
jgi:hypothetical protein